MRNSALVVYSLFAASALVEAADELYSEFSDFETQSSLRAGVGYTENVLLGESVTVDSPFAYLGLEGVASKPFGGEQYSWNSLAFADLRSFEKLEGVPDHSIVLLQTELEGYVGMIARGRIGARYLNLTQVFDATFDEVERVDFVVKADEPEVFVGYKTIIGEFSYDLEFGLGHMSFVDLSSDYDSLNLDLEVSRELTDSLWWTWELSAWERSYKDRAARDVSGIRISDTTLETEQIGLESGLAYSVEIAGIDHEFELSAAFQDRADLVSGYYDRSRVKAEFEWAFSAGAYDFDFASGYGKYRYGNQLGEDGARKVSESWYWELELERKFTESWSVFLNVSSDEDDSNESFATYDSRTALLGIRWR